MSHVTLTDRASNPVAVTGLNNGNTYQFTVKATNSVGTGPESDKTPGVVPAGPPSAPARVLVTGGNAQATVSWTASDSNGTPILYYTVTASPGGATTATPDGSTTTATVGGLANGTPYTFTVVATNAVGSSASSPRSRAVTPGVPPASGVPGPPGSVVVSPGNAQATVSWTPSNPNGSPVLHYTVTASPGGASTATPDGSTTTATVGGLTNGTSYTFTVVATNAIGDSASASSDLTPIQSSGGGGPMRMIEIAAVSCSATGTDCTQFICQGVSNASEFADKDGKGGFLAAGKAECKTTDGRPQQMRSLSVQVRLSHDGKEVINAKDSKENSSVAQASESGTCLDCFGTWQYRTQWYFAVYPGGFFNTWSSNCDSLSLGQETQELVCNSDSGPQRLGP